jgi:hypothetical protein
MNLVIIMYEVETLELMTGEKFISDVSEEEEEEEDDGVKSEPQAAFLSALAGINTVRKELTKFEVDDNIMATHSSIDYSVNRVQQEENKQQLNILA